MRGIADRMNGPSPWWADQGTSSIYSPKPSQRLHTALATFERDGPLSVCLGICRKKGTPHPLHSSLIFDLYIRDNHPGWLIRPPWMQHNRLASDLLNRPAHPKFNPTQSSMGRDFHRRPQPPPEMQELEGNPQLSSPHLHPTNGLIWQLLLLLQRPLEPTRLREELLRVQHNHSSSLWGWRSYVTEPRQACESRHLGLRVTPHPVFHKLHHE